MNWYWRENRDDVRDLRHRGREAVNQSALRRHIANLELLQEKRIAMVAERKTELDASVERAQRVIDNLKSQQMIIGVR